MTKAKTNLPQENPAEGQEPEKKAEPAPNGAEKNSANDADGSPNADAQTDAPASVAGKVGGEPETSGTFDNLFNAIGMAQVWDDRAPGPEVLMSIAVIERIKLSL